MKLSQIETRIESLPAVWAVGVRLLKVHQTVYERSGGRIGHRLGPISIRLGEIPSASRFQPRDNGRTGWLHWAVSVC